MEQETVLVEKKDLIGVITLNRPEAMNTFNVPFARALNDALLNLDQDDEVRVVVIRAAGKHFSTGISLPEFCQCAGFPVSGHDWYCARGQRCKRRRDGRGQRRGQRIGGRIGRCERQRDGRRWGESCCRGPAGQHCRQIRDRALSTGN